MLVLTRGEGEEVIIRNKSDQSYIGTITVVGSDKVRLGFNFGSRFVIMRKEIDPGNPSEQRSTVGSDRVG